MKIKMLVLGAAAGVAALAYAMPASAYVACNREGDCWHTESRYSRPDVRFDYHPDDWYFHRHWEGDRERRWHEWRDGRGYWRNGVWITF